VERMERRTLSLELFGGEASPIDCSTEDVNDDDARDLVCTFRMMPPRHGADDVEAILTGRTRSGQLIEGADIVDVPNHPPHDPRRRWFKRFWRVPRH
jgi:hypothetical protein